MISNQTISSFLLGIGVGLLTSALYNRAVSKSINVKKVQISSLDDLEQSFRITPAMLRDLVKHFVVQLKHGLKLPNQTMLALPSFVTRLPTGNEKGIVILFDLINDLFL